MSLPSLPMCSSIPPFQLSSTPHSESPPRHCPWGPPLPTGSNDVPQHSSQGSTQPTIKPCHLPLRPQLLGHCVTHCSLNVPHTFRPPAFAHTSPTVWKAFLAILSLVKPSSTRSSGYDVTCLPKAPPVPLRGIHSFIHPRNIS